MDPVCFVEPEFSVVVEQWIDISVLFDPLHEGFRQFDFVCNLALAKFLLAAYDSP
jgi:hypothetical protein